MVTIRRKTIYDPLHRLTVGVLVALACIALMPISAAQAASLVVSTLDDELNSDGDCSLREAITAANTNTAADACPAG